MRLTRAKLCPGLALAAAMLVLQRGGAGIRRTGDAGGFGIFDEVRLGGSFSIQSSSLRRAARQRPGAFPAHSCRPFENYFLDTLLRPAAASRREPSRPTTTRSARSMAALTWHFPVFDPLLPARRASAAPWHDGPLDELRRRPRPRLPRASSAKASASASISASTGASSARPTIPRTPASATTATGNQRHLTPCAALSCSADRVLTLSRRWRDARRTPRPRRARPDGRPDEDLHQDRRRRHDRLVTASDGRSSTSASRPTAPSTS